MTKYHSLFGGTITDTTVQVVQENQIIIWEGPGARRDRLVIFKVELRADGYMYHMVNTETKEIRCTDIINPLSQKFGIGMYYDDRNPECMDSFEVALLVEEAQRIAREKAESDAKEKEQHDRIAKIGAERLERIMPQNTQGVIIAELKETYYSDHTYECKETRSIRTVILGFSATSRNGFGELRKVAKNLPETAYLSEYNPQCEHRYPGFILGKSPYNGWSITKRTNYTRQGFIDMLAYTAGDENNILLSTQPAQAEDIPCEIPSSGEFTIVEYSDKAIAVFGDTKPIKDELSALGGRFNGRLNHNGQKMAGWVFQKCKEEELRRLLGKNETK